MQTRPGKISLMLVMALSGMCFVSNSAPRAYAVDIVDDAVQMDDLLKQVVQTTNSLCWEMHRYHQAQPGYADAYRSAKEIWTQAGQLRVALANGPVETDVMVQRANDLGQMYTQLEKTLAQWGPGDRSQLAANGVETRTVLRPGIGVDIPFVGVRVGGGDVVVEEDTPTPLQRLRLHPNSHGSKRSLERELAAVKVALSYLIEDAGVSSPATGTTPTLAPVDNPPTPQPPTPGTTLDAQPKPIPSKPAPKADSPTPLP